MSTIREHQADQSHVLLGRTRAERLLDGIYQRQKRYLLQRRRRAAAEAARRIVLPEEKRRRLLDVIPEPAVTGDVAGAGAPAEARHKVKQQTRGGAVGATAKEKNVEDAVEALQRHLWRHAKFDKAVHLLQQLWQSHLVPETKRCLMAGLLTAASTDNCISSPTGRLEVAALFRNAVEPILQRECERRRQAELKEQQERLQRTKLRAVLFNDRLQSAVVAERRAARGTNRATNALRPPGSAAATVRHDATAGERLRPGGTDAGTRATMAAVAAAAAAAVDREEQKQQQQHARIGTDAGTLREGRSRTDRAAAAATSAGSGVTAAVSRSDGSPTAVNDRYSNMPHETPRRAQSGDAGGKSESRLEDIRLNDAEKELLEVLQLRCKTHLLLFTDDAFQFNQQVAELRRVFDAMLEDVQAEDEPGLSDEEGSLYENSVQREAGEGNCDATDDPQLTEVKKGTLSTGVSSSGSLAEGPAVSSTTAAVKGDVVSAAHTAQQPKDETPHVREVEQRQRQEAVSGSSSKTVSSEETDKDDAQVASSSRNNATPSGHTAGVPSVTADPALSTGAVHTAAGAQKADTAMTGREEAGADEVGEEGYTATASASHVEAHPGTHDGNGNRIQSNAAGILPSEDAASYTAQAVGDAEEDEMAVTPEERWPLPLKKGELRNLLRCFFMDCLASIFSYRNMTWARAAIEQLFQHVYLNRFVFNESDRGQISLWQAQLKAPIKASANVSALRIGEAPVPVQDGREERISTIHGSMVWSAKQMGC